MVIPPAEADRLAITPTDRARSVLVLVLSLFEILSAPVIALLLGPGHSAGEVSDNFRNPITPPHWAFAIWGLIYLAMILLGVYQVLPGQPGRDVHRRSGWWLVGAMTASTVWVPLFVLGQLLIAQLVLMALVAFLIVALLRLSRSGPASNGTDQTAVWMPIALYLGWALVAAAAGVSTTLRWLGMNPATTALLIVSVLSLVVATGVCLSLMRRAYGLVWISVAVVYAFASLSFAGHGLAIQVTAVALSAATVLALVVRAKRSATPFAVLFG